MKGKGKLQGKQKFDPIKEVVTVIVRAAQILLNEDRLGVKLGLDGVMLCLWGFMSVFKAELMNPRLQASFLTCGVELGNRSPSLKGR